jgi:putative tricarboxylic transport membrane protein
VQETTLKTGDIASGAALTGLGIYIVAEARRWEYLGVDGPGPGFFPLWYGVAMIGLGLLLIASRGLRRARAARDRGHTWGPSGRALTTWAALAVSVGLLGILGFLCAFALFTWFVAAVMYRRPLLPALGVAVGGALAFYLVFPLALRVALPTGWFGF